MKGALEAVGIGAVAFQRSEHPEFALAVEVLVAGKTRGVAGQLSSGTSTRAPVFVAEIDMPNELEAAAGLPKFRELQRFPSISRDIALLAPAALRHEEILATIESAREPLLATVDLFDLFAGQGTENFGPGRKSLAYSLTYLDKNRTLTAEEVSAAHDRIRERLKSELEVELRE